MTAAPAPPNSPTPPLRIGPDPMYAAYKRRRRIKRIIVWTLVVMFVLVIAAAGIGYWLWNTPPAYWQIVDKQDPQVQHRAADFENRFVTQATMVRPAGQTWRHQISQQELNEWLAVRMPKWLASQQKQQTLPDWMGNPMIAFDDQTIHFACQVSYQGATQVVSFDFKPVAGPDDEVRLTLDGIQSGRFPVPQGPVLDKIIERHGSVDAAERAVYDKAILELQQRELIFELPHDHRKVRVVDIELQSGGAVLICQTLGGD